MSFYEDVTVGSVTEFGRYEVTEDEILSFARQYDPQWFHVNPERAREESPYGGLIASGWHTAAMTMRLLVDNVLSGAATVGAKGVDELRWWEPVRPGDTLHARNEVLDKEPDTPDRGLVRIKTETFVGEDRVFSMIGNVLYRRRQPEASGG